MPSKLLLSVQDAEVSFGNKILFNELSFNIHEGEKICLVGKNGVGKSTLMNIIKGQKELDRGLRWQLQGATIGHLQQEVHPKPGQTVYDYVFEELKPENRDGSHDYKIDLVVEPLELHIQDRMDSLSGGQIRRASLARALVESPNILLLDEPTNHLDLNAIEWLENYLKSYQGALVCISHDKAFLNAVSDKVFWLDRGKLKQCPRGFQYFEEWSIMLLEQEEQELKRRQKVIDQEVEWASRGVKARRKRNIRRLEQMKIARDKLRSDQNALKRMLSKVEFSAVEKDFSSTQIVAEFTNVSKSYSKQENNEDQKKTILSKFNLRIIRGDRIGIVGRNGSGKTTFLKLLMKEIEPDTGTIKLPKDMSISYFDQARQDLRPEHTLQKTLIPGGGDYINVMGKARHVCSYLKDFLFDPAMAAQPVKTLSGGQKNRLMLAKVLSNPGSLLILDEPTNDLDMDTLDMLEDILDQYTGTLLVVSHDRDFLEQTVNKILAFEGNGHIEAVIGGYQDYLNFKRKTEGSLSIKPVISKASEKPKIKPKDKPQKLSYSLQFELDRLPEKIQALENEINDLEFQLSQPELYIQNTKIFQDLSSRLLKAKDELSKAESRWLELEELR